MIKNTRFKSDVKIKVVAKSTLGGGSRCGAAGPTGDHTLRLSFLSLVGYELFWLYHTVVQNEPFFSGPVLQNDPQPFENFPKIVKILKKKNNKKI